MEDRRQHIEQLFKRDYKKMLTLGRILLHDEEEAKDVIHDIFTALLAGSTEIKDATADGMLMTSMRNRCYNRLQHKKTAELVHNMLPVETQTETNTDETDKLQQVEQIITNDFTPQTRRVMELRFKQQMSYKEMAETLHISEAAVYKHLVKGIATLKENLKIK